MKRMLVTIGLALLLLAGAVISLPAHAQNNQGRIEGTVTNLTLGGPPAEPLPSVEILVNEWMVIRSGRDGEWNITGLAPGEYSIRLNLPTGYSPAQDVVTATIWGDVTETLDLAYYEGGVPLPVAPATPDPANDRVKGLGVTATPTVVEDTGVATETLPAFLDVNVASISATVYPGQAGYRPGGYPPSLILLLAGIGLVIAGAGIRQLLGEKSQ